MKNYYFVLGISMYATEAEIKRAYRKLALQFHPDKNASRQAETIIKEINEAYEVLGDPQRKAEYDQLLKGTAVEGKPPSVHRDPRYHPRTHPRGPRRPTHREEILAMMAAHLRYAIFVSRLTLLFSIVLIADYSLPQTQTTEQIRSHYVDGRSSLKLILSNGRSVTVNRLAARKINREASLIIYRSALFSVPMSLEEEHTHDRIPIEVSIYGNFIFWPILLLATSLMGTFYWRGVEFRFNVAIINAILLILTIVFLQVHKF
ncbi:MAG: DnaJ domain-containing protein [Bacteroidetes bacterium]|nr:DnaJ domain-containing protein [Bacteroidota bacterium]